MTPLQKAKQLIEARSKATEGDLEQCEFHPTWVHKKGVCKGHEMSLCASFGDAKFFALAANDLPSVCARLIKVEAMLKEARGLYKSQCDAHFQLYFKDKSYKHKGTWEQASESQLIFFDAELESAGVKVGDDESI